MPVCRRRHRAPRCRTRDDWKTILLHIQAQPVRHPDNGRVAVTYIKEEGGLPTPERDHVQRQRQITFRETRQWMANARYALIRRGTAAPRFVLNDKGSIPMHDTLLDLKGVLSPLSGEIAVLMVVGVAQPTDDYEAGPLTERILNVKCMELVNRAVWPARFRLRRHSRSQTRPGARPGTSLPVRHVS
ncbi:hypothetical protein A6P39_041785 [Streptomyces sp. FXJ1.172]|uniref:hypothetical protein n=1 Tax=Streptomyces sp. FXJ1.172 TaxID=710705 RepID=UPI000AB65443|nr:hypothetical protein [Streptomyces sp. FXJ1.172]WEP00026.1 hypothetical protein A6P39_041785 [Streptomyces sp. FXJ1.172]